MSNQPRVAKVLIALLVSMTAGAVVLMALGNNPPSAGAFCLSSYYRLDPVEQAIGSRSAQNPQRWSRVEIFFSETRAGNIEQLSAMSGLKSTDELNCHFVVCNGFGGTDGLIQTTEKWQRQWSVVPGKTWYGNEQTVLICVIGEKAASLTDTQVKRTNALITAVSRKFDITTDHIYYPQNWQ